MYYRGKVDIVRPGGLLPTCNLCGRGLLVRDDRDKVQVVDVIWLPADDFTSSLPSVYSYQK